MENKCLKGKHSNKGDLSDSAYTSCYQFTRDIRLLNCESQAKVCESFYQYLRKSKLKTFFTVRFEETYSMIDFSDLMESDDYIDYAVNDMVNAVIHIHNNDYITFMHMEKVVGKVVWREKENLHFKKCL